MSDRSSKHVVICGAGIVGLCCAHYLRARGHEVTVLERLPAERDGCSFGNAGIITPSHFVPLAAPGMVALGLKWMFNSKSPFYIRPRLSAELLGWSVRFLRSCNAAHVARSGPLLRDLNHASRELYLELAARLPPFDLTTRGLLMLCRQEKTLEHEAAFAAHARELGVPAEVCTPQRAAELDPGVRMAIAGAVHFPLDAHFSPARFLEIFTPPLVSAGVKFLWETEVAGWRTAGHRLAAALTNRGEIPADEFVLAGGAWSPVTIRPLGLRLPMQAGKGYSLTLPRPRQLPQLTSIFTEARIAVTPLGSSLRIGGTMEVVGLDLSIQPNRVEGIIENVPRYFPDFTLDDFRDIPPWRGLRPVSPDGLPYLGRFARHPNLIAATGHAMMGVSLAPITGRLVADLVSGEKPSHDLALLDPDRFA
ncbi:MAG: FAD-dependent oxidoreductase [Verrucomicrobia bacterium]|nr:FAD-dependent oxidoreductase [Verrucomicrobiota bacterium]